MIKILFFIETLDGGGAEKVLRNLVNNMDQTRFEITVQTVWPCKASDYLAPGIRYKTVYPSRNKINQLRYRLEAASGLTYQLHIKDDYDIECAYLEMGSTKIMAQSSNKKAKKLAWVHCDLSRALLKSTHTDSETFARKTSPWYSKYDCVVCVSNCAKDAFDRIFHSKFPSTVIYNTIDDDSIRKKAEESVPGLNKRKLTVLAVGTLYPPKNYPRLLRAHKKLLREGIDHDLWVLGDGEQRTEIEQYIEENGLSESVTLFGFQNNPYPYMKAADVVACSSNYEGFSTVITESVILGKAVVTTECSGMREILGDSKYGLITTNEDNAFFNGLRCILMDSTQRECYAERAAERGKAFSMKKMVANTESFFERITENEYEKVDW